jgi:hypothetical protein
VKLPAIPVTMRRRKDRMKRIAAVAVTSALMGAIPAVPASADPGIGKPPDPSCFGDANKVDAKDFGGIRNAVQIKAGGWIPGQTIKEAGNGLRSECGRTSGFAHLP